MIVPVIVTGFSITDNQNIAFMLKTPERSCSAMGKKNPADPCGTAGSVSMISSGDYGFLPSWIFAFSRSFSRSNAFSNASVACLSPGFFRSFFSAS